ncbi:adenosylhomocysteinase [Rhizobium laguerreae]|uniref:adenosylhomocysteinase n=1 Tax=Rhizobium laguerreae TaxID=1076926 RepID=UPI001441835D|nr:adenosylhomocysteinase [Rhizobium laguerreae]MBY3083049.1 adenosylhomocysteinase [Rhizobium laguerreae]MBY3147517.1 adenosylhomocysteinase [Rhizobium laguerreae]MBY3278260.1 adenosylhomocysteinase [Rhizobium laguerreae]MBY3527606.1 adenosylhomocysteinase [Rhizobium laguerreae]MBY3557369.1 adenosylhomocysteinase [Rhizobium laguerreae]
MEKSATRIDWIGNSCRLLKATAAEFERTHPFEGLSIGTGIHLEPKTVALLMTLRAGGARLVCTGNLNSTQPSTVEFLRSQGITVFATQTTDPAAHHQSLEAVIAEKPDLLLDNGGDLFAIAAEKPYANLRGGTEETTSGRTRLLQLRERLNMPILVINDSPIKQFAENRHAVGQSLFESYLRFTNRSTNGKRVTVFGYGACGKGTAACFRNAFATVSVVDIDPVTTLEAHLDGFVTPLRDAAIRSADIILTVTGFAGIVTAADLPLVKDGAILMNGGHFPHEIDVEAFRRHPDVIGIDRYEADHVETFHLSNGRSFHVLGSGHMANLAGPRPLGNTVESMDLGFTLQARCLERIAKGEADAQSCIVPVPFDIDAMVASAYLDLAR